MGVMDSEAWRSVYNENLPSVTTFSILLSQNEALYAKCVAIKNSDGFAKLTDQQRRAIEKTLIDFELSGANLDREKKEKLQTIGERSALLTQKFSEQLLDATNAFHIDLKDKTRLAGLPESALSLYSALAQAARFTLPHSPTSPS